MPLIHVRTEVTIKADCIAAYEQVVREALAGAVQFGPDAVACVHHARSIRVLPACQRST
jgi:hypothetical protein